MRVGGWLPGALSTGLAWLLLGATGAVHAADHDPLGETLRLRVETLRAAGDARIGAGSSAAQSLIASLYERRGFAPLWSDPSRANALLAAIEASRTHGLDPDDYHAKQLGVGPAGATPSERDRALAERELLLTDAYLRLAYHLYFGKVDPRTLQHGWNYARSLDGSDPAAALARLLAAPDPAAALERLAPRLPMYEGLRAALARLREVERRGGWPRIGNGPKLEHGSAGPRVRQLRDRLRASGDLAAGDDGAPFDEELDAAVRRFQARHGLEVDGVVGRATLAALNTTAAERIGQVRANLERLRWVARELAGDYLLVDIAGFSAELWLNDTLAWQARVVVGRPFRTTPEFRAPMKYLVLNPEWNVPPTILREDVLPKAIRDPAYLQRHQMRVLDHAGRMVDPASIDWSRYRGQPRSFPYQIVQSPGKDNPLGGVKFMFPNEHAVYLHDTPSRGLHPHRQAARPRRAATRRPAALVRTAAGGGDRRRRDADGAGAPDAAGDAALFHRRHHRLGRAAVPARRLWPRRADHRRAGRAVPVRAGRRRQASIVGALTKGSDRGGAARHAVTHRRTSRCSRARE